MKDRNSELCGGPLNEIPTLNASSLAPGVIKRIVFGPGKFLDDWVLRYFILPAGESIPPHSHPWNHFVVSLAGKGRLWTEDGVLDLSTGNWGRVPPNVEHIFDNPGDEDFAFLCMVPWDGDPDSKKTRMRAERRKKKENISKETGAK